MCSQPNKVKLWDITILLNRILKMMFLRVDKEVVYDSHAASCHKVPGRKIDVPTFTAPPVPT
jgi:hypothetical protein